MNFKDWWEIHGSANAKKDYEDDLDYAKRVSQGAFIAGGINMKLNIEIETDNAAFDDWANKISGSIKNIGINVLNEPTEPDGWSITSKWSVEDIQYIAASQSLKISDADAMAVLKLVKRDFDANIGVNWEVLEYHLESYLNEKKRKNN